MMHDRVPIAFEPEQFEGLFPFHFVIDRSMRLVAIGRSLSKIDPGLSPGRAFVDVMRIGDAADPPVFEELATGADALCVIRLRGKPATLRGQFTLVRSGSELLFVGSPWLTGTAALEQLGLILDDFAVHDPAVDLLHLMQAQNTSLADARRLADVLTKQRAELREANSQLAAQEAESRKLAMIAARTDNAVILTDAQGRIEWVNHGFVQLTGFTLEEVRGRTPGSFLQGEASDQDAAHRMRCRIRDGLSFRERVQNYTKDGRAYWVLIDAEPIHDATGAVTNFMAIERDVTKEHLAAQQAARLATLNEITREIVESFIQDHDLSRSIGMILARIGEFLDVSRSYLFRYRQNRQRLSNTHEWCAPGVERQAHNLKELPGDQFPWWTNALRHNELIVFQDVASQAPQEVREILAAQNIRALLVLPVIINGQLEAFIGFDDVRHVREWRSEEVALLRTMVESLSRAIERRISERDRAIAANQIRDALERAESANELKSAFLASMSHELRTPMTAIMGFAHLLSRSVGSAEDRHAWADAISRNADHLLALLNDLLDLSKIEAGQLTVVAEACDPSQIVADVIKQLRPLAADKSLPLELVIDGAPPTTTTDGLRLRQIVVNLVGNAIRYTDAGHVRVRVSGEISHRSENIAISVSDTGIGIPAEKHDLLFLPFSQVHPDAQGRGGGVGLGLNISRRLAELLGGALTFTSAPGVGSEFVVRIPVVTPKTPSVQRGPLPERALVSSHGPLSGARILMVDDSPDNRQLLTYLLSEAGASVTQAENGQQACDLCLGRSGRDNPFDVILMDMQMPVMDGYSAAERLRSAGLPTPILALTAYAMADDRDRCLRAGCDDYLSKPINETALLGKLAAYAHRGADHRVRLDDERTRQATPLASQPSFVTPASASARGERHWLEAVIEEFRISLPNVNEQLRRAFETGDLPAAAQIAHRLRGVAASFRLPELAAAAASFEDEYRANGASSELTTRGAALLTATLAASRGSV